MRAAFLGIDSGRRSTKALLVEAHTRRILSLGLAEGMEGMTPNSARIAETQIPPTLAVRKA
jgi:hypothetical protein